MSEERKITKIAREVNNFTATALKKEQLGSSELDLIHAVRHHPGILQKEVSELLNADKGGIARRVLALERKGYLIRKPDERDRRKHHLYATERAQSLKQSRTALEEEFYSWLVEDLPEQERQQFLATLQTLYLRSKLESRAGFPTLLRRMKEHEK